MSEEYIILLIAFAMGTGHGFFLGYGLGLRQGKLETLEDKLSKIICKKEKENEGRLDMS